MQTTPCPRHRNSVFDPEAETSLESKTVWGYTLHQRSHDRTTWKGLCFLLLQLKEEIRRNYWGLGQYRRITCKSRSHKSRKVLKG